jgi:hypothetical protein
MGVHHGVGLKLATLWATRRSSSRLHLPCPAAIRCTATPARSSSAVTSESLRWRTLPARTSSSGSATAGGLLAAQASLLSAEGMVRPRRGGVRRQRGQLTQQVERTSRGVDLVAHVAFCGLAYFREFHLLKMYSRHVQTLRAYKPGCNSSRRARRIPLRP